METSRTVERRRLAGLDVYETSDERPELTVVLLHGYGADGADLLPLAAEIPSRRKCRWLFPEAPQTLPPFGVGRAWFPLDEEKLMAAQQEGRVMDFSGEDPPALREAGALLAALVREAAIDPAKLVVGGFSQGAMVAADFALESRTSPAGLVMLSGNLIAEARWRALAAKKAGMSFVQSHGRQDPILGFAGAERLETLLRESGLKGSLIAFDGGHAIPSEALSGFGVFLDDLP